MKRASLEKLVGIIRRGLSAMPIPEQIEIYEVLADLMPTKPEREKAAHIAWTLREVERQQLDFSKQLFRELQWPGHQHDGEKGS